MNTDTEVTAQTPNDVAFVSRTKFPSTYALFFSVENLGCGMDECGKGGKE